MPLNPPPVVAKAPAEKILDAAVPAARFVNRAWARRKDLFQGMDLPHEWRLTKIDIREGYDLRRSFRAIGRKIDNDGKAVILSLRRKRDSKAGKVCLEILSKETSLGHRLLIGPDGPVFGTPQISGGLVTGVTPARFTLKEAVELYARDGLNVGTLRLDLARIGERHRVESIQKKSDGQYTAAGVTCRRRIYQGVDFTCVVFTTDADSSGKSMTNQIEHLAEETSRGLTCHPATVRWYEHRTDEQIAAGYKQDRSFMRVRFISTGGFQNPEWWDCGLDAVDKKLKEIVGNEETH